MSDVNPATGAASPPIEHCPNHPSCQISFVSGPSHGDATPFVELHRCDDPSDNEWNVLTVRQNGELLRSEPLQCPNPAESPVVALSDEHVDVFLARYPGLDGTERLRFERERLELVEHRAYDNRSFLPVAWRATEYGGELVVHDYEAADFRLDVICDPS